MDIIEDLKAIFPIKEQISVFLSEINKKDKISDNGIKEAANSISLDEEKADKTMIDDVILNLTYTTRQG